MVETTDEQRRRLASAEPGAERWSAAADRFRADPRRDPDPNLKTIMEYVAPQHVVLDVGGGAGRYALPIALRCREVINVEPSKGMGAAFEASAAEAGIKNARRVPADWLSAGDLTGDVSIVANVTYFVADIVPFVEKLVTASRERVIVAMTVTPPPNQTARTFEVVRGEPQAPVPGYRELLPVLWEMGIVPDVRVLQNSVATALGGVYPSREEAIETVTKNAALNPEDASRAGAALELRFDELFSAVEGGFRQRPTGDPRMILVTWRTHDA
jgi:SAM-dependent methyltransferase